MTLRGNPRIDAPSVARVVALHAALLLVGLWLFFGAAVLSGLRELPSDDLDGSLNNLLLEQGALWARGETRGGFLDLPGYFPVTGTRALTETDFAALPLYASFRALGAGTDAASVSTWACWLAALYAVVAVGLRRTLGASHLACSLGGFLVAFGSPRAAHFSHQQLYLQAPVVLALLALADLVPRACRRDDGRLLAIGAIAAAAQAYACLYLAWMTAAVLLIGLAVALALPDCRRSLSSFVRATGPGLVGAAIAALVLIAPLALAWSSAQRALLGPTPPEIALVLPSAASWLHSGWDARVWGWTTRILGAEALPSEWEQRLGVGLVTTVLVFGGFWSARNQAWGRWLAATLILTVALSTRWPGGFSPWPAIAGLLPGGEQVRAVPRLALVLLLPAAVGVALAIDRLRAGRWRRWVPLLGALVVLEQAHPAPSHDQAGARIRQDALVAALPADCSVFHLSALEIAADRTLERHAGTYRVDAMWAALRSGRRSVAGYASHDPADFRLWFTRAETLDELYWHGRELARWLRASGASEGVCWLTVTEHDRSYSPLALVRLPTATVSAADPIDCRIADAWTAARALARAENRLLSDDFESGRLTVWIVKTGPSASAPDRSAFASPVDWRAPSAAESEAFGPLCRWLRAGVLGLSPPVPEV